MVAEIESINAREHALLVHQDAGRAEILNETYATNAMRDVIFDQLVGFHMVVKQNTKDPAWGDIMKTFDRDMSITLHWISP